MLAVFAIALVLRVRLDRARHGHDVDAPPAHAGHASSPPSTAAAAASTAAVDVPLARLLSDYADNEVRGDERYRGKYVRVTGVVGDVRRDVLGDTYVTIGTGAEFESPVVQCFLATSGATDAASLSHGQRVTVRGRVDGLMLNVLVRECVVER